MSTARSRGFGRRHTTVVILLVVTAMCATTAALASGRLAPGPQPDATGVTPEGWHITPVGHQTQLGPGPLAVAASPRGNLVLVADGGYTNHALVAIDPSTGSIIQTIIAHGGKSVVGPWSMPWGTSHSSRARPAS